MGLIAREDADIGLVWNVIRFSPCHLFGGWAKRWMTFQSMLGPEGSIKNIQIRQMHIVYEPIM